MSTRQCTLNEGTMVIAQSDIGPVVHQQNRDREKRNISKYNVTTLSGWRMEEEVEWHSFNDQTTRWIKYLMILNSRIHDQLINHSVICMQSRCQCQCEHSRGHRQCHCITMSRCHVVSGHGVDEEVKSSSMPSVADPNSSTMDTMAFI